MIKKYRKKPVVIEAIEYTGNNWKEIIDFCGKFHLSNIAIRHDSSNQMIIRTLEGNHFANIGDFVIRGTIGEFYPCKSEAFEKTYEEVIESNNGNDAMVNGFISNLFI